MAGVEATSTESPTAVTSLPEMCCRTDGVGLGDGEGFRT
jgi:hypothetical protein